MLVRNSEGKQVCRSCPCFHHKSFRRFIRSSVKLTASVFRRQHDIPPSTSPRGVFSSGKFFASRTAIGVRAAGMYSALSSRAGPTVLTFGRASILIVSV